MTRPRYVYVISSSLGYQKIGWSIYPEDRLRQLNAAHPMKLQIYQTWEHPQASRIEIDAHFLLAQWRTSGEWFGVKPEVAAIAVEHAIKHLPAPKILKPRYRGSKHESKTPRYTQTWTEDRTFAFQAMWESGWSTRDILDELNSMPGSKLESGHISIKAKRLKIQRPDWVRGARDTILWSAQRQAYLINAYPNDITPETMLEQLNVMAGDRLIWSVVSTRARKLKLRRSPVFKRIMQSNVSLKLSPRWTSERDAYLAKAYSAGELPQKILDELLFLSGPQDLTWNIVRERAKHKKIKRPEGFFKTLGFAVAGGDYRKR